MKFEKRRVTNMKTCRRNISPTPLSTEETIVLKTCQTEFAKKEKSTLPNRVTRRAYLRRITKNETKNLKSLEKRVKNGKVVIMQTDKSRKLTINKPDNYIEQMKPHLRNDPHITTDEQNTMERTLTCYTVGQDT